MSVLMPVYNGECYLAKAVESILNQTFNEKHFSIVFAMHNRSAYLRQALKAMCTLEREGLNVELIVGDDNSTDDTPCHC